MGHGFFFVRVFTLQCEITASHAAVQTSSSSSELGTAPVAGTDTNKTALGLILTGISLGDCAFRVGRTAVQ